MSRARARTLVRSSRNEVIAMSLLALAVVGAPLAIGALHTEVLSVVAVVVAAAAVLVYRTSDAITFRRSARVLILVGAALTAYTLLQTIPMPAPLVRLIAPATADAWARSLRPLQTDGPFWVTLSLDPVATRVQVLRGVTYLLAYLASVRLARGRDGVVFLERLLVGAGVVMALVTFAHPLVEADKVFGVYKPGETYAFASRHIAPLLNTNHLGGFANIGLLVAVGALFETRDPSIPRPFAGAAVIVLLAASLFAASRGGTLAMCVGLFAVAALALLKRRREKKKSLALGKIAVVGVVIIGGAFGFLALEREAALGLFQDNSTDKLRLIADATRLLPLFPAFGVGRGAFESVYPAVRHGGEYLVYTHPENFVLQWVTEWGVPAGLAAIVAVGWALAPKQALSRSRVPAGAYAALVAGAIHNLLDFNNEVPGIMLSFVVAAALVTGGTGGVRSTSERPPLLDRRSAVLVPVLAASVLVCVLVTLPNASRELYREMRAFQAMAESKDVSKDEFHARFRSAVQRHPAEAYFPFTGALRASVARDEPVLPWANRALERSPTFGRVHLVIARTLVTRSPAQARLEYRLAYLQDAQMFEFSAKEGVRLVDGFDDAIELTGEGESGLGMLAKLSEQIEKRLPATQVRLDQEISTRDATAIDPLVRRTRALLSDVKGDEAWCADAARKGCLDEALDLAKQVRERRPAACVGHSLFAEARVLGGDAPKALEEFYTAASEVEDVSACFRRVIDLAVMAKEDMRVTMTIDRLSKLGCSHTAECVDDLVFCAGVEDARKNRRRAFALYKQAFELAPDRYEILVPMAGVAASSGMHGEALDAYKLLAQRRPNETQWAVLAEAERQAMVSSVPGGLSPVTP